MKIGLFTDSYLPSPDGVATSVESTAKELQKLGHEVYIIAPDQPHKKDRKSVYRLVSVRIIKSPDIWWALQVPQPALFKVANLEFDIIHGHSGGPISFLGWQLAHLHNIPFIETYHTLWKYYRHYLLYPDLVKHWMVKKFTGFIGNDCDAMIAPSVKAKNDLLSDGVKKPVYVVPNGIYIENFQKREPGFLRKQFDIPADKKIILTVGRLNKEKAIDFLIKAFAACKKRTDAVFVIVGTGPKHEMLQNLAAKLSVSENVVFTGAIPYAAMPDVYADADIFVFASQTETQGMVIVEALASGVPVIAVEDNAFVQVVENGRNGYLMKKDTELFADKLKLLFEDSTVLQKLKSTARTSAQEFAVGYTTRILEQVYLEVLFQKDTEKQEHKRVKFDKELLTLMGVSKMLSHEYASLRDLLESLKQE